MTWLYALCECLCTLTGNTRVISQTAVDHFRTSLSTKQNDPYSVLLRRNKLPMSLLDDASNPNLRKVRELIFLREGPANSFGVAFAYSGDGGVQGHIWPEGPTEEAPFRCWHL